MSDVIELLEKMGSDARLFQAVDDEIALALADAKVDALIGEAILSGNAHDLHALLNVEPQSCFQTFPQREDEEEQEGDDSEEGGESSKQSGKARALEFA